MRRVAGLSRRADLPRGLAPIAPRRAGGRAEDVPRKIAAGGRGGDAPTMFVGNAPARWRELRAFRRTPPRPRPAGDLRIASRVARPHRAHRRDARPSGARIAITGARARNDPPTSPRPRQLGLGGRAIALRRGAAASGRCICRSPAVCGALAAPCRVLR
jgi:hypothetical protein